MKLAYAIVAMTLLATFTSAMAVRGIDRECMANGFDYGIVKYQCGSYDPDEGDGTGMTITWHFDDEQECEALEWSSTFPVDGVLSKEGDLTFVQPGGTSGYFMQTGQNAISHATFCGKKDSDVPEFSAIAAGIVLISVAGFVYLRR